MKKLFTLFSILASVSAFSQTQVTWSMGMDISASSFGNLHPRVVADASGDPLVIWNHNMEVRFAKWTGSSFSTPVTLNPVSMSVAGASWMGPDIASKGDTVYVVFKLMPEGDTSSHIYVVRSFDAGASFSAPFQVDHIADSLSRFPTLSIDDSGNPIVAFMKFNSSYLDSRWVVTRSNDFGSTFLPDVKVSGWAGSTAVCDCCPGVMTTSGNAAVMVYRDNNNNIRDMWAGISLDNANTFGTGMPVDENYWQVFSCPASGPDGVIVGDSLYAVYMSAAGGSGRVYFSTSSVSIMAGTMGNEITGTFAGLGTQNYPRIATDGTAMGIAWRQTVSGTDQAVLLFTRDIALGFPAVYDTVDLADVTDVDVAISNGNVYVVWEDGGSGTVKFRSGSFNSTTGLATHTHRLVSVSPAVTKDFITVNAGANGAQLTILDAIGHVVLNRKLGSGAEKINMAPYDNGIYMVTVVTQSHEVITNKIVKYE